MVKTELNRRQRRTGKRLKNRIFNEIKPPQECGGFGVFDVTFGGKSVLWHLWPVVVLSTNWNCVILKRFIAEESHIILLEWLCDPSRCSGWRSGSREQSSVILKGESLEESHAYPLGDKILLEWLCDPSRCSGWQHYTFVVIQMAAAQTAPLQVWEPFDVCRVTEF